MKVETRKELLVDVDMKAVRVTKAGPVTEVLSLRNIPKDTGLRKLDADTYLNTITGEVKEYEHIENRAESTSSIRRTMRQIRLLVNANVTDPKRALWVTLTYAENMTDTKRLYSDFKVFWLRLCRFCKKQGYGKPEFISVVEPQGRGAWHVHLFLIWEHEAPFIPNNEVMEKLWEHGWTKTKSIKDVDNVGAYFSAYLADIPVDEALELPMSLYGKMKKLKREEKSFEDEDGNIKTKKFIKGGRLALYPRGMCMFRHSRGIKEPTVEWTNPESWEEKKTKEKSQLGALTFSSSTTILNDDGEMVNLITKEYYNSNRKADVKLNGGNNNGK